MSVTGLSFLRQCSSHSSSKFFVTTPIYYVNANPHIGHLYSSVIADAIQRWRRLLDPEKAVKFKFSTGTDEHGMKIQQAAASNKSTPSDYCLTISDRYKNLAKDFSVNYTDFIRTSCDREHRKAVHKFWNVLKAKGKIYSAKYGGWYCVSDECFLPESQLKEKIEPDGRKTIISGESGHPVEWIEEVNYMFPLQSLQEELSYWIRRNENVVRPGKFRKILLDMVDSGPLPAISVSRPSTRVHWGIQVPDDETQTVYVWLDALVNYLTAAGYAQDEHNFKLFWPPDVQVVGKDILKFHGIYWPAFLIAADMEPPRSLLCHSHWTVDGEKMSKSKGNVVCPTERSKMYTTDGLRYFLLREGVAHSDGNYSDTKVVRILNSELADTLGNLLSRCCGTALNPNQTFPEIEPSAFRTVASFDVTKKLIEDVAALPDACFGHYSEFNFYKVVDRVMVTLHLANLFFESLKPWELKKATEKSKELDVVLHLTLETLRVCGILLQPIIPNIAGNLLNKINVEEERRCFRDVKEVSWNTGTNFVVKKLSEDKSVLFKRIVQETNKTRMKKN